MDLAFTAEQQARRGALRSLLAGQCPPERVRALEESEAGFCIELWKRLAAGGWLALDSLLELAIRFEELGRAATPGPFLAHFESLLLLREIGARELLDGIAAEARHASLAVVEASGSADPRDAALTCERTAAGLTLTGTKLFVPWADTAGWLLVVGRQRSTQALVVLAVDPELPAVERIPLSGLGAERLFEVRFGEARVGADACLTEAAGTALDRALSRATLLACAELAGAAGAALQCAVAHARGREQFGRPIGAFQAVAHHCANMALDVDAAQLAVWDAASRIDAGEPPALHAARAKVVCSEAARRVTATAHQVMGGVGFLADTDLHLWTRRAKALESRLGAPDWHRERVADALDL
jgi:alkylation response protein AidB-like acyl-CoA dehydrogenase